MVTYFENYFIYLGKIVGQCCSITEFLKKLKTDSSMDDDKIKKYFNLNNGIKLLDIKKVIANTNFVI